ncbi:leucine rich repeat containing 51 [Thecamonas trahens ATCC 50062]|uniref:Leucine rich repeat containing 51 n=1 Tax=Thecamonas trahens ATCC 50062 TaxID=461836 RepID=A0A0L0DLT9_THETB|nr:leucine rich repeat containing 51 [Thecamonas trahens ATCC 50062]KNC53006.1 leucine rich repeat containing 51 [Thecamonas trahens ATCC 50062]|eukprot:XP_013754893.1 leucine rich repeat containing 51 [Thecamonas trahens ATCC 50062]
MALLERVVSHPERELGGRTPEQVRELYLGHKGIQKLSGFERFRFLNDLYLEGNALVRLTRISHLTRLTTLSVHNNMLTVIDGVLSSMPCLEVLLLHRNQLRGLHRVAKELAPLKYLTTLTLFGNPVEEELGYRRVVVTSCKALTIFDRKRVTQRERRRCDKLGPLDAPRTAMLLSPSRMLATGRGRSLPPLLGETSPAMRASEDSLTPLYLRSGRAHRLARRRRTVRRGRSGGSGSDGGSGSGDGGRVAFWTTAKPRHPEPPPHCRPQLVVRDLFRRVEAIQQREEREELEELTKMFEEQTRAEIQAHRRSRTVPLPKSLDFLGARRAEAGGGGGGGGGGSGRGDEAEPAQPAETGPARGCGLPPTPFVYKMYEWEVELDDEPGESRPGSPASSNGSSIAAPRPLAAVKRTAISSSFAHLHVREAIHADPQRYVRYRQRKARKQAKPQLKQSILTV